MTERFEDTQPDLPEGWASTRLSAPGLIQNVQTGFACGSHSRSGDGVPHLRPMNVSQDGTIALHDLKLVPRTEVDREDRWVRSGDVLFNNTNSPELVGKTAYYGEDDPRAFSNHMTRLRTNLEGLDPKFCALALHHKWQQGHFQRICNNHVSQASVSREVLLNTELLLPPLAEQRRIVAKVEALVARVDAARGRLAKLPALLRRFRQSVLAAACSGQLTADWRAARGVIDDAERDAADAPDSWTRATVQEVCEAVVDCPHSTPKWATEGDICLRTTNFQPGRLDLSEVRYVSAETYRQRIARLEPKAGDIVYSREGGILGIACMIPEGLRTCLGQRMMLMRPGARIDPTFLMHVLNSPSTLAVVKELTGGTASPHLNVGDIKQFVIPLPTREEQREIIERLTRLNHLADLVQRRLVEATARSEKLTQAILAKAFRGQLVPTEAALAREEGRDYEPGGLLLQRVLNATRGNGVTTPRRPRRSRAARQVAGEIEKGE